LPVAGLRRHGDLPGGCAQRHHRPHAGGGPGCWPVAGGSMPAPPRPRQ
jgi:hypothetical protein